MRSTGIQSLLLQSRKSTNYPKRPNNRYTRPVNNKKYREEKNKMRLKIPLAS